MRLAIRKIVLQELCHVRRAGVRTLAEAEVHHEGERRRLGAPLETGLSLGSGAFAQVSGAIMLVPSSWCF